MSSQDPQGMERRQYVRIKKNYILLFSEKNAPSLKYEVSQIENISKGGLCFSSTVPFPTGTILSIQLKTPYRADAVDLEGQILQVKEKVNGLIYEVRLQFRDVHPQAAELLDKIEKYNTTKR